MAFYSDLVPVAQGLLQELGQAVIWRSVGSGVVSDPDRPWVKTPATPTDYPVRIAFLPLKSEATKDGSTDVVQTNLKGLMASVSFTPKVTDTVIRGGQTLAIQSLDPVNPGGITTHYKIIFR